MLAPGGRDLAENRDAALEFSGRDLLEIDVVLLQQAIDVGHLRDDADAADDRERRGEDAIGDAGHQISAARRDLIDRSDHADRALAQPRQLRRGEAIARHRPAGAFDAHHDLVRLGARDGQHGVDLAPSRPTELALMSPLKFSANTRLSGVTAFLAAFLRALA